MIVCGISSIGCCTLVEGIFDDCGAMNEDDGEEDCVDCVDGVDCTFDGVEEGILTLLVAVKLLGLVELKLSTLLLVDRGEMVEATSFATTGVVTLSVVDLLANVGFQGGLAIN